MLKTNCEKEGVHTEYRIDEKEPTGRCGVIITGKNRSLITHLAAANEYKLDHLQSPKVWDLVKKGKIYYVGGYHLTVCVPAILAIAEEALKENKVCISAFNSTWSRGREHGRLIVYYYSYLLSTSLLLSFLSSSRTPLARSFPTATLFSATRPRPELFLRRMASVPLMSKRSLRRLSFFPRRTRSVPALSSSLREPTPPLLRGLRTARSRLLRHLSSRLTPN